ncbi:MAG: hypothetical protein KC912_19180 [Proteobacteria bacterium]|nr:hypothetical protein [Pseudomonadota bacterium]
MRRDISAIALGFASYGALILLATVGLAVGLGVLWTTGNMVAAEAALGMGLLIAFSVVFAVPFLGTAWGLHGRRAWSKWPALVLAVLIVGSAPVGTLLGGYTLYTLLDGDTADRLNA